MIYTLWNKDIFLNRMLLTGLLMFIIVANGQARSDIDCNFENDLCQWTNQNNWKIKWKKTSMDKIGYMNSNDIEKNGACLQGLTESYDQTLTAQLWGPDLNKKLTCISFDYVVDGGRDVTLTLMRREMGSCERRINENGVLSVTCENYPIWSTKNAKRNLGSWTTEHVSLSDSSLGDYKMILEGTIPLGSQFANICVDNITSSTSQCTTMARAGEQTSDFLWIELYLIAFACAFGFGLTIPIFVFVVCFVLRRLYGITRDAKELDFPQGMASAFYNETTQFPQRFMNPQVGKSSMYALPNTSVRGYNYTIGKRNGPQRGMDAQSRSGNTSQAMTGIGLDSVYTTSFQQCEWNENDEDRIDQVYSTLRQRSVPANVRSNMNQVGTSASYFAIVEDPNAMVLQLYPPPYEETMGYNQQQMQTVEQKPPLLPPRVPKSGSSEDVNTFYPLPPSPV